VFYWFLKWVALGPWLKLMFRPQVSGAEHIPSHGPAILASNHLSYADWLFMPLTLTQGRVLQHPGHQGLVPEEVLLRCGPGADRPRRRQRR
jgi:1-acyl-sn-glycerol-3-phosphate acyltransferase